MVKSFVQVDQGLAIAPFSSHIADTLHNGPRHMPSVPRPRILVVDDSSTILNTTKRFLEPAYEVVCSDDGFRSLAVIQQLQPDLLLLDVMLPRLDGYQICMTLRNNPLFEHMPIIFLTGKDGPFDKARGRLVGGSDYLVKPFENIALLDVVRRHLRS